MPNPWRFSPPSRLGSRIDRFVAQVGRLIQSDPRIREIDVNPVVVYSEGQGAVALDGLIYID
jgi:hypothetical protein